MTLNYTGDVLNFGMATEKAKAAGVDTEFFALGDDVGYVLLYDFSVFGSLCLSHFFLLPFSLLSFLQEPTLSSSNAYDVGPRCDCASASAKI